MTHVRVLTILSLLGVVAIVVALGGCAPAASASWPASQSGNPTFYYFGSPG